MPDAATILAQFATAGDQEFLQMFQKLSASMKTTEIASDELRKRLDTMLDAGTIKAREHLQMMGQLPTVVKNLAAAEQERVKVLNAQAVATEKNIADMSRQSAEMAKVVAQTQLLNSTALGRFNASIYGGTAALEKMETSAYRASRNATALMRSFVTAPIQTMNQFAASTEKAAIASQFLKEQLAFVAASRFGSIMIGFAIFGTAAKMIHDTIAAMIELDTQAKFVETAFVGVQGSVSKYEEIQRRLLEGSVQFGQNYKDMANILWELKSAGLSASDSMAGFETNQKLVIAGAANVNEATRLTSGLFRTFGKDIEGATNSQEKFRRIGEVLATVVYESQGNMDDLVQAFKNVISTADIAAVPLGTVAAAIGTLNNKMLFGSKAGTSLNSSFLELAKNYDKLVAAFNLKIDPTKTIGDQFLSVLKQLQDRFKGTAMNMQEMSVLFDSMNIRGGRSLAGLITSGDDFWKMLVQINTALEGTTTRLDDIAAVKLDSFAAQWDRLKKAIQAGILTWGDVSPFKWLAKTGADATELWMKIEDITGATGLLGVAINTAFKSQMAKIFKGDIEAALRVLEAYPKEIRIAYQTPGLLESVRDSKDLLDTINALQNRSLTLLIPAYQQEQLKKDFEAVLKLSDKITDSQKEQSLSLRDILMEQRDYNTLLSLGLATHGEINKLVGERIAQVKEDIVRNQANAEKVKELSSELGKLLNEQKSLNVVHKDTLTIQERITQEVEKTLSAYQQMESMASGFADTLRRAGRTSEAQMIAQMMAQQAEQALELARTDDQRLKALQGIINAYKMLETSGYSQTAALNRQIQAYYDMYAINQNIIGQDTAKLSGIQQFNNSLQNSRQQLQQMEVYIGGIKQNLQFPADSLNFQGSIQQAQKLNQSLQTMDVIMGGIAQKVQLPVESFDEIQVYMGGILQKVKVTADESDKWGQGLSDNSDAFKVIKNNIDDTASSATMVNQVLNSANTPAEQLKSSSENISQAIREWISPINDSNSGINSMKGGFDEVQRAINAITANLSNLANQIRSMPKLNISGGGGVSNNDLLTNPEYQ